MTSPTAFFLMTPAFQRGFIREALNHAYPKVAQATSAKPEGKMVGLFSGGTRIGKCRSETLQLFVDAKLWKKSGKEWRAL